MSRIAMAPGIYPGLSFAEYFAIDAVSHSALRGYRRSAAHARYEAIHPRESKAMDFGTAFHEAVLEPERYAKDVVRGLEVGNRSSVDKDAHARLRRESYGKTVLDFKEYDLVSQMTTAVMTHETAGELLRGPGWMRDPRTGQAARANEVVVVWRDPETGLLCKLRADAVRVWQGWTWVIDLKTTCDASPEGWPREVHTYGYDSGAAFYLDGFDLAPDERGVIAPRPRKFVHIACEKDGPLAVAVHELDEPSIAKGRARYRKYLRAHAAAVASGNYPAYPSGVLPTSLPSWSLKEELNDDDEPAGDGAADESGAAE
jgi:hypothetical protein